MESETIQKVAEGILKIALRGSIQEAGFG